jgi:hypothetical protein
MYDLIVNAPNKIPFVLVDVNNVELPGLGDAFTVSLSKAGGAFASGVGTKVELEHGWYLYTATANECSTLGPLALSIGGEGALRQNLICEVKNLTSAEVPEPGGAGITSVLSYLRNLSWMQRSIAGQYLEGLADGTNCIFRIPFAPIVAYPVPLFYELDSGAKSILTVDAINYDSGEVIFATAPESIPLGDYFAQAVSNAALTTASTMGFAEMQVRWPRTLYIYDGGISSEPDQSVSTVFATSVVQNAFLNRCAEYELYRSLSTAAVMGALSYREERMGGLLVDTTKQPKDWASLLESLQGTLKSTEDAARSEAGELDGFGVFLPGPQLINGAWTDASF